MAESKIREALKRAQEDPVFAVQLVKNPSHYAKEFNLSPTDIERLGEGHKVMNEALRTGRLPTVAAGGPYG